MLESCDSYNDDFLDSKQCSKSLKDSAKISQKRKVDSMKSSNSTQPFNHGDLSKNALEIFYQICKIPHKSGDTKALCHFIVEFLKECKCVVKVDDAGNIHALKGSPKLAFQAHYDMVLVGENIEPIVKSGFLQSLDSSLGADNGVAVALILALAKAGKNIEALLTNDEEIGMLGARNLTLKPQSKIMINLDSENLNEICVGCAGGFDADIALFDGDCLDLMKDVKGRSLYALQTIAFQGGHSGIDIHKNIPNAIIELLKALESLLLQGVEFDIIYIRGGENRNSIPMNANAIIAVSKGDDTIANCKLEHITISKYNKNAISNYHNPLPSGIIRHLLALHNGIYEIDSGNVLSSLNFSLIDNDSLKLLVRANKMAFLQRHILRLQYLFGKNVTISGLYNAWEREDSTILGLLQEIYKKHNIAFKVIEIHAGLECGILKEKCDLSEVISIGPTILNPHSKGERLDLDSFITFCDVIIDIVESFG